MTTLKMCSLDKESFNGVIVARCLYGKNITIGGQTQCIKYKVCSVSPD